MQVIRPQNNFRILPGSVIKSPGSLLSSVKTEPSSPQYSSDYLLTLETIMTDDENLSDVSFHDEEQSVEIEITNPTSHTESPVSRIENDLQKNLSTLDHYNVAASFRMDEEQASRLLAQITSELSELPATFVRRLELKIMLANTGNDKTVFGLEDLYNKAKINDKLYRMIFERLLVNFSDIVSLWPKFDTLIQENRGAQLSQQISTVVQIEKAFYSIMQNKKYPKSKFDVIKLRHLLIAFDTVGFSQEWFKDRNRKLKQGYRVSFVDEEY